MSEQSLMGIKRPHPRPYFVFHFMPYLWNIGQTIAPPPIRETLEPRLVCSELIGGSRGPMMHSPPQGSKFFHFHAVFSKKLQYNSLAHTL